MVEIKEEFKTRLEHALRYRDIKPAELSRLTGISEATISQYRSGYSKPKDQRLVLIANALGVDPSWLMGLDVPMNKSVPKALEDLAQKHVEEQKLLGYFRQLNDEGKIQALAMLKSLSEMEPFREEDAASSDQTSTA